MHTTTSTTNLNTPRLSVTASKKPVRTNSKSIPTSTDISSIDKSSTNTVLKENDLIQQVRSSTRRQQPPAPALTPTTTPHNPDEPNSGPSHSHDSDTSDDDSSYVGDDDMSVSSDRASPRWGDISDDEMDNLSRDLDNPPTSHPSYSPQV